MLRALILLAGLCLVATAAAATGPGRTGPFRADVVASYTQQGHRVGLTGTGVVDSAGSLDAHLVFTGLPKAAGLGTRVAFDEIVIGGTLYLRSPLLKGKLPAGKTWVKVDLRTAGSAAAVELELLQGIDPSPGLSRLLAPPNAKKLGQEIVRGTATTHYRVDVTKPAAGAAATALVRLERMTGQKSAPIDVWVDVDGVVRKVAAAQTSGKNAFSVSAVYSNVSPARIAAPPAARTFDAAAAERLARKRAKANATNPWAQAASKACRRNDARAKKEMTKGPGTTQASQLAFTRKALPLEVDLLGELRAIKSKPPVGAKHAVDLLAADVAEARGVIAAAGNAKLFTARFERWIDDHRANDAFGAAGIPACA